MFNDRKKLYILTSLLLAALLIALFLPGNYSGRIAAAVLLLPLVACISFYIKKRNILSMNKKEVTMLMAAIGLVYVAIYYLSGLKFGFYRNIDFLNFNHIIPLFVIIAATEVIRWVVRAQEDKKADVICYVACVVADALCYGNIYYITSFNRFIDFLALTIFPAVIANLVYSYMSKRYGIYPNLIYRCITTLYAYLIPILPSVPDSLFAFANLFVPIAIYLFVDALYEKKRRYALAKKRRLAPVITAIAVMILAGFVMLISNQFKYGALVIATESMTGEINKGDAVIFEAYDSQTIEKGQVIVFEKNDSMIVHRVVDIERINGQNRYITKGDANEDNDAGYVTKGQIRGLVNFKVPLLGYPTLWLRSLFDR